MKRLLRRKWIKVICGILAAVSLPVTICAAIVFGVYMERGCIVTNSLKLAGKNESIREMEIESIAEYKRMEILDGLYMNFLYDNSIDYDRVMEKYSKEDSNYYFSIKPLDDDYPAVSNYYDDDYQYKNTEKYLKNYYESLTYTYPYSRDTIAEEWLKIYKTVNDTYEISEDISMSTGEIIEGYMSKEDVMEKMEIEGVWLDNTLAVAVDGVTYDINLASDRDFIEDLRGFEIEHTSDGQQLNGEYSYYDEDNEKIVYGYVMTSNIELEYTEYLRKELTAHDEFYYSPFLKYDDIIANNTIPALIGGSLVLLASSVLLCISAGRRYDREEVVCGRLYKIPLEILILIYILAVALFCLMLEVAAYDVFILGIIGVITIAGIMSLMYPAFLCTVAVRVKTRSLLKNTLICKIFKRIKKCFSYLWRNIHIYGKFLGVYIVIILFKTLCAGVISDGMPEPVSWMIMWLADIIVAVFLVIALINMNRLKKGALEISKGNTEYKIDTSHMLSEFKQHGETLNNIGDGIQAAVEERIKSERMKTELITNVSHDIKTPITSIISYVDLLDKENIENEKANEYIEVLKRQSERLKKLVQDLIDASKASTGNMPVNIEQVNINVMLEQIIGESMEKLLSRKIKPVVKYGSESAIASADGRLLYRSIDNLIQNIYKYAMENSRVYIDVEESSSHISVTLKNISQNELNVSGDELMERFVRGDSSRNTEGSGLGLSIAKSLMEIQGGSLKVVIDGDLFKAVVIVRKHV